MWVGAAAAAEPAARWAGESDHYRPLLGVRPLGFRIAAPLSAALTAESVGATRIASPLAFSDAPPRSDVEYDPDTAMNAQLRVGFLFDSDRAWSPLFIAAEYEHDLYTGVFSGGLPEDDPRVDPPMQRGTDMQLRKAYGRVTFGPIVTVAGGFMTSHWGLGLVANDGDHGWAPGSAYFGDPRGGDRVLRGYVMTGPWTHADLVLLGGYDVVQDDDVALGGDEARQIVASAQVGFRKPRTLGLYAARREQEAADGKQTKVTAVDLYGKWTTALGERLVGQAELESAFVFGTTELAPTPERQRFDVRQLAVAARVGVDTGDFGTVLDFLYASGDQNFDDGQQNGFKADPNFEMGMLLFRHLLAATTSQAPVTAADPLLSGVPSEDLDRIPTRGSITNTYAFFPRLWYRPVDGLEIYGGPLFAFANVSLADPARNKMHGGDPHNAFDASPGDYLGTELDVGVRYRALLGGSELTFGLEGALLQPGDAFDDAAGQSLDALAGGRATIRYRL